MRSAITNIEVSFDIGSFVESKTKDSINLQVIFGEVIQEERKIIREYIFGFTRRPRERQL